MKTHRTSRQYGATEKPWFRAIFEDSRPLGRAIRRGPRDLLFLWLGPWAVLVLLVVGCGGPGYSIAPVSGKITLDGKPLAEVRVSFQPQGGGPASVGVTDAEGKYQLRLIDTQRPGAMVGTHRVYFSLVAEERAQEQDDAGRPIPSRLPAKYRNGTVTFTVPPAGTDQADFQLSSRP